MLYWTNGGCVRVENNKKHAAHDSLKVCAVGAVQSTAYRVSTVCHVCATSLLDRADTVRGPSLSNEHLSLHADVSAQCSTALLTMGGYAGNT